MLHSPCGSQRPNASCMVKDNNTGKSHCSKSYPKAFSSNTLLDDDSYPTYRRREGGFTWTKKVDGIDYTFTNRDVVPYNPYLLERYKCHVNVKVCTSITAVKYLYKYIYKGSDRALTGICENDGSDTVQNQSSQGRARTEQTQNEIRNYEDSRYICATEACFRLFQFKTHDHSPSVERLQVHLPNRQSIVFNANANLRHMLQDDRYSRPQLTEFFKVCERFPDRLRRTTYLELPRLMW